MKGRTLLLLLAWTCAGCSRPPKPPAGIAPPPPSKEMQVGALLPRWESIEAAKAQALQNYRLAEGDWLDIMVFGHEDMRKELPIRPDGKISYPLVGDVQAAGLSVEELRQSLNERLRQYLRFAEASVILKKSKDASFSILGSVVRPGVYPIQGPTTLLDGIAAAQGLSAGQYEGSTIEIADLQNSFLVRRGKVVPIDFQALLQRGDTTQNVLMENGDYVYIPSSLAQEVFVLGDVFKPRSYGFRGRVSLLEAVAESGGFRPTARLGEVILLRASQGKQQVIRVNVKNILHGKTPDLELQVGDIVFVPRKPLAGLADLINQILPALFAVQLARSL